MTTVQYIQKWGEREVEMHELHPYITRTRIRLIKILTSKKNPRIFGLNLDSQRGTLRAVVDYMWVKSFQFFCFSL